MLWGSGVALCTTEECWGMYVWGGGNTFVKISEVENISCKV